MLATIINLLGILAGAFGTSADFAIAYADLTGLVATILDFVGGFIG